MIVWTPGGSEGQRRSAQAASAAGARKIELTFLREELQAGLCAARVALATDPAPAELAPRDDASIAYGIVLLLLEHVALDGGERQELEAGLAELRSYLTQLGV